MLRNLSLHKIYYFITAYTAAITLSIPVSIYLLFYGDKIIKELSRKGREKWRNEY